MKTQSIWKEISKNYIVPLCVSIVVLTILSCNSKTESKSQSTPVKIENKIAYKIENDSLEKVVKLIIDISANDFYKNQKPLPVKFRNVQIKYHLKPTKEMLYILCGQFQAQDKTKWTQFATIKNSEYEQWIGPNGLTYCENSTEIPYAKTNLSRELENRLLSLENRKE